MADVGKILAVSLEARITKMEREMKRASEVGAREFDKIERRSKVAGQRLEQNMARAGAAVRQSLGGLDKALLGGLAAGGLAGIVAGVRRITGEVAALGDEARRAGVGVEAFQEWRHVAEQNRIPLDAMTDALKELNIRADEFATTGKGSAADAFARLGLAPAEVQERLKDPSAFMLELIERTQRLGDTAAGIRVFDELFGGTGGERLVTLLSQSRGEIEGTIQQARDLGLVMSEDLVASAAELDRKFNIVANTVGTALKGAVVEAAAALDNFLAQFQQLEARSGSALDNRMRELGLKQLELERRRIVAETTIAEGDGGMLDFQGALARGDLAQVKEEAAKIAAEEREILAILNARKPFTAPTTPAPAAPATPTSPTSSTPTRDRYAEIVAGVHQFIAAQAVEQQALGLTAQQAAALRYEHDMLNQAIRAGIALSPAQRAEIEQLAADMATAEAATRALTQAQEAGAEAGRFFGEGIASAFTDIVTGASTAEDAMRGLLNQLVRVVLQAALLGTGPLGGLTGGNGLFGGLRLAGGGEVHGPGTSSSDSIPALLSDGEHVIRASEARKHRALLTAINAGKVGHFADGGAVGRVAAFDMGGDRVKSLGGIAISAPITVTIEGSGGTEAANLDLANKTAAALDDKIRQVVADSLLNAMRPGNLLNR